MKKSLIATLTFLIMIFAMNFMFTTQVQAEMTYDLNGNQVDVSVWQKSTSLTTGNYKITSSEAGTIAYFDKDGNLLRLENKETGEVIINNEQASEKPTEALTTKAPDKITMPKVKSFKKQTKYSYYKGVKEIKKNGKSKWGKIKYKYGIKLTWKRVKGAKGYEIYRYENAAKRWTKIKTLKKNSKKPYYTLTNMLAGENVKVKVRAYKNTNTGREYGKYSKTLKFKTKKLYTKIYKNAQCKNFYSKFASEDAFVIQNQYRTAKGRKRLIWSDKLYDIAVLRCKMMATKDGLTHTGISRDQNTILKQYGITTAEERRKLDLRGENIASFYPTPKTVMMAWKKSKGHYDNILNNDWTSGAIGVYFCKEGQGKWCADFSGVNYDEVLENLIIEK